jgi:methionyl-tRNA synthetase
MRIFIAVAWPYASGPRHIGHAAGAYLPADVAARYHRLAGDDVVVVSGSDQHGTPITVAAERAGVAPAVFADRQHRAIARSFARLGIAFDRYTKTSTPQHAATVHDIFRRLLANGLITEGRERSAWCPTERRALPDRYVEGRCPTCSATDARGDQCDRCGRPLDVEELDDARCLACGARASLRDARQLFLRLDLLADRIRAFHAERASAWPPFVAAEARGWVREGLRPRAITRQLDWGVPVPLPGWDDRRLYVWFDAVIGYLTATIEWADRSGRPHAWRAWWHDDAPRHRYFIGKDNVPFHTVWWPAILAGADRRLHLPDSIDASHHLLEGARKLSSGRGHGPLLDEAIERIGADPLRHALCALRPETADAPFSWDHADHLTRAGLLGSIANPPYRVATLLWRRFAGAVDPDAWRDDVPGARRALQAKLDRIGRSIDGGRIRDALSGVHELGRELNRRLADAEPWRLEDVDAHRELTRLVPPIEALGVAATPFVPATAAAIRALLGWGPATRWEVGGLRPAATRPPLPPLSAEANGGSRDYAS